MSRYKNIVLNLINDYSINEARIDKGLTPFQIKIARAGRFRTDPKRVIISTEGIPMRRTAHRMLRGSTKAAERATTTSLAYLNRPGKYSNTKILPAERKYIEVMKRARSRRLKDQMPPEKDMNPPYK
jgi:hypothetical protein